MIIRSRRELAEVAKMRALLRLQNAQVHADGVLERFGALSPDYAIARRVVDIARKEVVAAYDVLLDLDRGVVQP